MEKHKTTFKIFRRIESKQEQKLLVNGQHYHTGGLFRLPTTYKQFSILPLYF